MPLSNHRKFLEVYSNVFPQHKNHLITNAYIHKEVPRQILLSTTTACYKIISQQKGAIFLTLKSNR